MGGPMGCPMLESQKLGGSNVAIPKVGGVRTPPTRAVAAPMDCPRDRGSISKTRLPARHSAQSLLWSTG